MRYLISFLCCMVFATASQATTYYTTKSGSNSNTCAQAQVLGTAKLTVLAGVACLSAGDTLMVGDGIYDEALRNVIPSGTSTSNRVTIMAINRRQAELRPTSGIFVVNLIGDSYVRISGMVLRSGFGAVNSVVKIEQSSHFPMLDDNEITGSDAQGVLTGTSIGGQLLRNYIHHNGDTRLDHGIYHSSGGQDWLIDGNEIAFNARHGIQIYPAPVHATFSHNYVHDNCQVETGGDEVIVTGTGHVVEYNTVIAALSGTGINAATQSPLNITLRHNSVYCKSGTCSYGVRAGTTAVNTLIQNNLAIGFTNGTDNDGTGTILTDNRTTGTASSLWTDPANGNLTLLAGSAAINDATNIGLAFNGAAPDHGAYETFVCSAGTITGNIATVQCSMALNTPLIPGSTGWTVNNGRTVTNVALQGSSTVLLTFSGAACAGESWTFAYSGGTATDKYLQPLHTISATSLTNLCSAGPSYTFTQTKGAIYEAIFSQETSRLLTVASPGGCFAVRQKFKATGGDPPEITTKTQVSTTGEGGTYADVPDTFGVSNIAYIGQISLMGLPAHTTPIVLERLTSEFSGMTPAGVRLCQLGCETPSVDLAQDAESEQVDILCTDIDSGTTTYHFRLVQSDGTVMTYAGGSKPSITLTPPSSSGF
jgi:Right handed beta helix region